VDSESGSRIRNQRQENDAKTIQVQVLFTIFSNFIKKRSVGWDLDSMNLWIRIGIEQKSWIRIRIESIRIHNPGIKALHRISGRIIQQTPNLTCRISVWILKLAGYPANWKIMF
jgi:hypothetical protein